MRKTIRDGKDGEKKPLTLRKFAMGGVAKIRHGQSTEDGVPKKPPMGRK